MRLTVSAYFDFTQERPKLWNLLNEHRLPVGREVPAWYQAKLESLLTPLEEALAPCSPERMLRAEAARAHLWASVHGMTSLSTVDKLSASRGAPERSLVDDLVSTYVAGLQKT